MEQMPTYAWLMKGGESTLEDPFDAHLIASIFVLAMHEAKAGGSSLSESTGMTGTALTALVSAAFPHAVSFLESEGESAELHIPEDECCLRELLARFTTNRTAFQFHLAQVIARRAMRPNHLWQDLGLRNRGELSELMRKHFEPLSSRNVNNMKWKKFLYRMICRDEGFRRLHEPSNLR